jgi:hypothetical protein
MRNEKLLFLGLTLVGVFHNPLALIPAGMVFIYVLANEHSINKKNHDSLKKHIDEEIFKLEESFNNTTVDIQRVKDSIIGLKLERGLSNRSVRNG